MNAIPSVSFCGTAHEGHEPQALLKRLRDSVVNWLKVYIWSHINSSSNSSFAS